MKDWTGNKKSTFTCLGASNHCEHEREVNDYYATDPFAAEILIMVEPLLSSIWECAWGEGHLAKVFAKYNKLALASDLINRGYGNTFVDFLKTDREDWYDDIVTNPPYKYAKEFVEKSLELIENGRKVCMLLKLTFLEGKTRKKFFKKYPPKIIYVFSGRLACAKNGDFKNKMSSAVCYAWFVWEKGFKGKPTIEWVN